MNLGDFFTPEAGQSRRAWLDALDGRIDETLAYYLGPQLMPRVRGAVGAANELTDFADYRDAVLGADQMATGSTTADRIAGAGTMATGLAAMMVPGVSARMAEGATDVAGDLARFIADEDGGIRVWHGSPHDFDKFSMDKIGTGEGAQAYGHGLYFAESRDVGEAYRDTLASKITVDGKTIFDRNTFTGTGIGDLDDLIVAYNGDMDAVIGEIRSNLNELKVRAARRNSPYDEQNIADYVAQLRKAEELAARGGVHVQNTGRLYEVDLHASPEDFLDWDAPLSAQAKWPAVFGGSPERTGAELLDDLYREGVGDLLNGQPGALVAPGKSIEAALADSLREAGIPGIRFLDQGSRGAGDGTRNYVVFDENIIEIVKKYGIAGAAAMLGLSAADVEAQVAAQPVSIGDWLSNNDMATLQEYLQ